MARKSNTNAYVRISSTKTIRVTCGLQFEDVTNKDAHIPDRLRVLEKWSGFCILITKGEPKTYPSEILEWPTVKSLIDAKVLTVDNSNVDEPDDKAREMKAKVEEMKEDISPLQDATSDITEGE